MRYTLHQSLVWTPTDGPPVVDDPDSRYEDETVTKAEALDWIESPPEAGSTRAYNLPIAGLGNDYVLWYAPVASSRVLVVRWMRRSEED